MKWARPPMRVKAICSFLILLSPTHHFSTAAGANSSAAVPHCPTECGGVGIHYPFGIGPNCSREGFGVECRQGVPYLAQMNLQLLEILEGEVRINSTSFIATSCPLTSTSYGYGVPVVYPPYTPYTFSSTANVFVDVGVADIGIPVQIYRQSSVYLPRCVDWGSDSGSSCIGTQCCGPESPFAPQLVSVSIGSFLQDIDVFDLFDLCLYGYVVEEDQLLAGNISRIRKPNLVVMKIEWAIGKKQCTQEVESPEYECGGNSTCIQSKRYQGYLCKCLDGFEGNPYLGCQDIDECKYDPCVPEAECHNEIPGFKCMCPRGSLGNGKRRGGEGCGTTLPSKAILGVVAWFGCISLSLSLLYCVWKQRNLIKLKSEYFKRNGGILLEKHLSSLHGSAKCMRIYSARELKVATKNYSVSRILGTGGNGTVYKGILEDGLVVAVKKSQVIAQSQIDQFINEIIILSQVNHRNVVKLLGCCLEIQVPMLVYEFISNGSLYETIHNIDGPTTCVPWNVRFNIATEVAEALSYLHSSTSMPIFHRDVKSSNILLDKNYTAKVADFGLSRFVPIEKTKISTAVQGTFGYLDPEYFNTGKLTGKSDVYSFGIVLLELLTGRTPTWPDPSMDFCNLAMLFLSFAGSGNIEQVLDVGIVREENLEEILDVADIAMRCLRVKGEERPSMKEVAQELMALRVGWV